MLTVHPSASVMRFTSRYLVRRPAVDRVASQTHRYFALFVAAVLITFVAAPLVSVYAEVHASSPSANYYRIFTFVGSLVAMLALLVAIGVAITGRRLGILWTARNTYSLSRLQVTLWSLLVLAALAAVVSCRARGLFIAQGPLGVDNALNLEIPQSLLALMGISVTSAAAVPAILSMKAQASAPTGAQLNAASARLGGDVQASGGVLVRPANCPPLVRDLFQGDDISKAGTVDFSKVQQAVITLILWVAYLGMLCLLFWTGQSLADAAHPGATNLPKPSSTFVFLLGISHAGYLAYKAAPVPSSPTTGTVPSTTPVSATLPRPQPPTLQ